jgi:capsular polysaccharide biosynthesis protein
MTTRSGSGPRPLRRSVVVGLVLALLVLAAGAAMAATQHKSFTAEAVLVVLPSSDLDESTSAAFYETMSRGQIIGTFAEVADNAVFENRTMDDLGLGGAQRTQTSSEVSVVPNTSVILVRVTAAAAATSEQVADGAADRITTYLTGLSDAYRIQVVHGAGGSATRSGMSPALVLLLAGIVALVLGLAAQQAVYRSAKARRLTTADGLVLPEPDPGGTSTDGAAALAPFPAAAAGRRQPIPAGRR